MSEMKIKAARKAVEYVKDGMILGLGTGSTTKFAVEETENWYQTDTISWAYQHLSKLRNRQDP